MATVKYYRICWTYLPTGYTGHGDWFNDLQILIPWVMESESHTATWIEDNLSNIVVESIVPRPNRVPVMASSTLPAGSSSEG